MTSNGYGTTSANIKPPPPLSKQTRKDVDSAFDQFSSLIAASNRPLPNRYGNGSVKSIAEDQLTGYWTDIATLRKGGFILESISALWEYVSHQRKGGPVDDKTMIVS